MSNQSEPASGDSQLHQGQSMDDAEGILLSDQLDMVPENSADNNRALKEQIDPVEQSLNREMVSLKGEFAIVAQGTDVEKHIDQLGQSLQQELLALKSELAIVAQNTALEERIDQLGQTLQQDVGSLKSEFAIVAQGAAVAEQIDQLGQLLNRGLSSLRGELEVVAQGMAFEEQIRKLGKYINQEVSSLRNELAMFANNQSNQENTWKIAALEWQDSVKGCESQRQTDIREMQHTMSEKIDEHFQCIQAQLQDYDNTRKQELSVLISQLAALQQDKESTEETQVIQWQKKVEEQQTRLMEDVNYMQYVLEEIATCPRKAEAQQKLREKFFIREISALKEEIATVGKKWEETRNNPIQQEINLGSDDQTQIYKKKRKRRH